MRAKTQPFRLTVLAEPPRPAKLSVPRLSMLFASRLEMSSVSRLVTLSVSRSAMSNAFQPAKSSKWVLLLPGERSMPWSLARRVGACLARSNLYALRTALSWAR
jgi:hypothetical protein